MARRGTKQGSGECSIGRVKPRLALLVGGLAVAGGAVFRVVRGRRRASGPDPAEELRRKLDESRSIVEEREEFEAAETPVDRVEPQAAERRRAVHEQARATIDEMRRSEDEH